MTAREDTIANAKKGYGIGFPSAASFGRVSEADLFFFAYRSRVVEVE